MSTLPVSNTEYEALRAVADRRVQRAADLGPWAIQESGRLIEHTMNRLRSKGLMDVPARGGTPRLTDDGRASLESYEARVAAPDVTW